MRSKRLAAERGGGAQAGDLFGVLDLAQFGDQRADGDEEACAAAWRGRDLRMVSRAATVVCVGRSRSA